MHIALLGRSHNMPGFPKSSHKFGMGVSKILGYLVGGTRIPYSQGGAEYPTGMNNTLGYVEWGCQIF